MKLNTFFFVLQMTAFSASKVVVVVWMVLVQIVALFYRLASEHSILFNTRIIPGSNKKNTMVPVFLEKSTFWIFLCNEFWWFFKCEKGLFKSLCIGKDIKDELYQKKNDKSIKKFCLWWWQQDSCRFWKTRRKIKIVKIKINGRSNIY